MEFTIKGSSLFVGLFRISETWGWIAYVFLDRAGKWQIFFISTHARSERRTEKFLYIVRRTKMTQLPEPFQRGAEIIIFHSILRLDSFFYLDYAQLCRRPGVRHRNQWSYDSPSSAVPSCGPCANPRRFEPRSIFPPIEPNDRNSFDERFFQLETTRSLKNEHSRVLTWKKNEKFLPRKILATNVPIIGFDLFKTT